MGGFDPSDIAFPQSFQLRVIMDASLSQAARAAIPAVARSRGLGELILPPVEAKGERHARLAFSVTFTDIEQMRAFYADLGAIPGIKAVL